MALTRCGKQATLLSPIMPREYLPRYAGGAFFGGWKEGGSSSVGSNSFRLYEFRGKLNEKTRPEKSKSNEDVPISLALIFIPILSSSKRRSIMKIERCIVRTGKNDFAYFFSFSFTIVIFRHESNIISVNLECGVSFCEIKLA